MIYLIIFNLKFVFNKITYLYNHKNTKFQGFVLIFTRLHLIWKYSKLKPKNKIAKRLFQPKPCLILSRQKTY
ncbi:hypothetical protein C4F49_00390 [Sphingobacterium sp. KB22]|uniref:Uncharacterized protein n=1 Tax=Sphingobacterium hungaricum TaxID=2082723 RepID=A0A928YQ79_9SPHI|nr:hypothetical protein [Sphingobacterium hungaricum]